MSREDLKGSINELAAGYVLGNLSPEEAETLQQYVSQNPEFAAEIDRLYDILGVIPYALTKVDAPINLRTQLLATIIDSDVDLDLDLDSELIAVSPHPADAPSIAQPPPSRHTPHQAPPEKPHNKPHDKPHKTDWRSSTSPKPTQPTPITRYRVGRWVGRSAAAAAIVFGLMNWQMRRDLAVTRTALIEARDRVSELEAVADAQISDNMPILQPDATLASAWQFDRLIDDHRLATQDMSHGYAFQTSKILEIVQQFQDDFEFAPALPVLNNPSVRLISGSFCDLGQIPGFRFSYQTKDGRKLSLYQVGTPDDPLILPDATQGRLHVRQAGQPEIILWSNDGFDYALVAEMSREQLETIGSIRYQAVSR